MGGVSTSQFQVPTNGCAVFSGTTGEQRRVRLRPLRARAREPHRPHRFRPGRARGWTPLRIQCAHRGGFRHPALPMQFHDEARRVGGTSAGVQRLCPNLPWPRADGRAAAESCESQLGWISHIGQTGRAVSAGDWLDQSLARDWPTVKTPVQPHALYVHAMPEINRGGEMKGLLLLLSLIAEVVARRNRIQIRAYFPNRVLVVGPPLISGSPIQTTLISAL